MLQVPIGGFRVAKLADVTKLDATCPSDNRRNGFQLFGYDANFRAVSDLAVAIEPSACGVGTYDQSYFDDVFVPGTDTGILRGAAKAFVPNSNSDIVFAKSAADLDPDFGWAHPDYDGTLEAMHRSRVQRYVH
ncbi:MAG: hypothetical protein ACE5JX_18605 [Acidobacteriota bacterium]